MNTERLSVAELLARYGVKPLKYGNRRCKEDGHTFDSEAERDRYRELKLLMKAKRADALRVHPRYPLIVNGVKICDYEADFSYVEHPAHILVVEDVKSPSTAKNRAYRIKRKLFEALYPAFDFREIL